MMFYIDKLWYGAIVYNIQMKGFVAFASDDWHKSMTMIVHKTF